MNNQEKRVFIKCAGCNLFPSEVLRILPVAETCSRHLSSAARGGRGWGSRNPASGVFQAQGRLKIDRLHFTRKLWRPQNQDQAPALSEVSVGRRREGKTGADQVLASQNPQTSEGCYPKLLPRPFGAVPSLPSSGWRHPTTLLSPEPQDTAQNPGPRVERPDLRTPPSQLPGTPAPADPDPRLPWDVSNSWGVLNFLSRVPAAGILSSFWCRSRGQGQGWVRSRVSAPGVEARVGLRERADRVLREVPSEETRLTKAQQPGPPWLTRAVSP